LQSVAQSTQNAGKEVGPVTQAYIYVRFSSPGQERGSSRERQIELCRAFAEKHGWTIAETIEDLGISAWKGAHLRVGNLGQFAKRVQAGKIEPGSVLVVEHLDRLSRQDPRTTQRWLEDVTDAGLAVANVSNGRIFDSQVLRSVRRP
jgi:DNA invertase Pin-like site-specific DNA recombinase